MAGLLGRTFQDDPGAVGMGGGGLLGPMTGAQKAAMLFAGLRDAVGNFSGRPTENLNSLAEQYGQMNYRQQVRQDRLADRDDRKAERAQDRTDKMTKPVSPERVAALGYRPSTVLFEDGLGNIQIGQASDLKSPEAVQQTIDINRSNDLLSPEAEAQKVRIAAAGRQGGENGLFSMIDTPNGMYGVTRRGSIQPMIGPDGKPLVSYHSDVGLRYNMNAAGAGGKNAGTAAELWPTTDSKFKAVTAITNGFFDPKVRAQAGKSIGYGALAPTIPGVNSDFRSRQKQLQGAVFLNAFEDLKGGGAVSEVEGTKAEQARMRAISANTPDEFYSALEDFNKAMGASYYAARTRAQRGAVLPQMGQQSPAASPTGNVIRYDAQGNPI